MTHLGFIDSVNLGTPAPNPYKNDKRTGINKRPTPGRIEVRAPGAKLDGLGSGIVGDFIGDAKHHGGDEQALYAFEREDLDAWQERLERDLTNGFFGENLTTRGFDVNDSRVGDVWRIGDVVEVCVTGPRTPCSTFRGWVGEKGWLKTFSAIARPGAYLSVRVAGFIEAGDAVTLVERPSGGATVSAAFRASLSQGRLIETE
jgi:MOSC domain-containing protein YiiM